MIQEALALAVELHKGQFRDGPEPLPYVFHPIEVTANLRRIGGITDEEVLSACLLHDAVEETGITVAGISLRFGARVAQIVDEMTRREPSSESIRGLSKSDVFLARQAMFEFEITRMGLAARQIKLADRLSNVLEAMATRKGEALYRYLWQSRRILDLIPRETSPELWDALDAVVDSWPIPAKSKWFRLEVVPASRGKSPGVGS